MQISDTVHRIVDMGDSLAVPTEELLDAAQRLTATLPSRKFDTCSIINAKSGRCPEDCKWCAQSAHHNTNAPVYPLLDEDVMVETALQCRSRGIGRFSFVTSGKRLNDREVDRICGAARKIVSISDIGLCISGGLLDRGQLERLRAAGISRIHCNLESAPSYFGTLCTTHSQQQKIATLKAAVEVGMDICSGGIIGMGESEAQRVELAVTLRDLGVQSIPVNVLHPIPGTPLENISLLSDEDFLRAVAIFRLVNPQAQIRLAGGVARFCEQTLVTAYRIGANAAILGDMLTTTGEDVQENMQRIRMAGYEL